MKKKKDGKINVAHILPNLDVGGAEKLAIDICSFLDKSKFNVEIISLFPAKGTIYEDIAKDRNLKIVYLDKKNGLDLKIIPKLIRIFKDDKIDIVHTHLYVVPYVISSSILSGIKVRIHTVHNIANKELTQLGKQIMYVAYKYFRIAPVAISDYIKKTIEEEYHLRPEKIACIYNAIDTSVFKKEQEKIGKNIRLINVGRLTKSKNQKLLLESFYLALQENENIELVLVGDGEMRGELEQRTRELKIESKVIFRGIQKDIKAELNDSDIYVLSSNYEGLPLTVLEAMACGLPIITTRAGGVIDIVENNKNGLIVDVGDQVALAQGIIKLIKDGKLRKNMGLNSSEMAKEYDVRKMAKRYEELYSKKYSER